MKLEGECKVVKIGDIRKPSERCVKWEHNRNGCYDIYEKRIIGGKKYSVWVIRCSELVRIGNKVISKVNKRRHHEKFKR